MLDIDRVGESGLAIEDLDGEAVETEEKSGLVFFAIVSA